MMGNRTVSRLSIILVIVLLSIVSVGLLYSTDGKIFTVFNIYGQEIELFGDGIYAYNSVLKATIAKGSDFAMIIVAIALLITNLYREHSNSVKLLHAGFVLSITYYSITAGFGIVFNRIFVLYILLFSIACYTFLYTVIDIMKTMIPNKTNNKKTAIFIAITGCTTLVWLVSIVPTTFTGETLDIIGTSTTEPTFIIDLGLILPTCLFGARQLIKQNTIGYIITPIMFTFLSVISVTVISQSIFQFHYNVVLSLREILGYVITFVIFGTIAVIVNLKFLRKCWK